MRIFNPLKFHKEITEDETEILKWEVDDTEDLLSIELESRTAYVNEAFLLQDISDFEDKVYEFVNKRLKELGCIKEI